MRGMIVVSYEQMFVLEGSLLPTERIILGIDPGLANTGWGVVRQSGARLQCLAYGCVSTSAHEPLAARLRKIYEQTTAVVQRFKPSCVGIETVWFGQNITAAFATGQARGAACCVWKWTDRGRGILSASDQARCGGNGKCR